ncbi:MAG TPA: PrsW family intramembrane metalloprotease [Steroidobacteraceae bacterium]|nr:PrsW family intramembrane metalloprotease [Steroidobacteraceae bacterium]
MENKRPGGTLKQPVGDSATRSQLLPIQTNWRAVMSKGYFWPGIATAVASVLLFGFLDSSATYTVDCPCKAVVNGQLMQGMLQVPVPMYLIVLALYISAALAFAAYRVVGKVTAWYVIPAVAGFTYLTTGSRLLDIAHVLDFGVKDLSNTFSPVAVIQGFFAAGLPEEALKAIPIGIGVWLAHKIKDRNHFMWPFRVVEPLDGILLGVASGLGFTLFETLTQYVPQQIVFASQHLVSDSMAGGLLIPRVLQNIAGHACWAGIFGYYIGLAALRPASATRLVPIGLGLAAFLHGFWDGSGESSIIELIVAVGSFAMLAGAIMKARELSPNRSQLVRSQVVGVSQTAGSTVKSQTAPRPTPGGSMAATAGAARSQTWGQRSETWEDAPKEPALEAGGVNIPLTVGVRITESQVPQLKSSAGDGVVAIVAANPDDVRMIGLKNLSTATWHIETVGRGSRELSTGRSIRIERGVRINAGEWVATIK